MCILLIVGIFFMSCAGIVCLYSFNISLFSTDNRDCTRNQIVQGINAFASSRGSPVVAPNVSFLSFIYFIYFPIMGKNTRRKAGRCFVWGCSDMHKPSCHTAPSSLHVSLRNTLGGDVLWLSIWDWFPISNPWLPQNGNACLPLKKIMPVGLGVWRRCGKYISFWSEDAVPFDQ